MHIWIFPSTNTLSRCGLVLTASTRWGLPGIGSSREQVNSFDEQLEVLLVPAFPSAAPPSSSTGLVGATSCLPCLDLSLLLFLELDVHFLYLEGGAARCSEAPESLWPLIGCAATLYLHHHCGLALLFRRRGQGFVQGLQTRRN